MKRWICGWALIFAVLTAGVVRGEPMMWAAHLFTDNAVLQRDVPIPVWGWAEPGSKVTVEFIPSTSSGQVGQTKSGTADESGRWRVTLDPVKAGGPHKLRITGPRTIVLKNILVGEVWLCSGQSNMVATMGKLKHLARDLEDADLPQVRFSLPQWIMRGDFDPMAPSSKWRILTPESGKACSALAFYLAVELHRELKVPVGVIVRAVNGTSSSTWVHPDDVRKSWDILMRDRRYKEQYAELQAAVAAQRKKAPKVKVRAPCEPGQRGYGNLWFQRIAPCVPYAIRGVCWDQGESGPKWTGVHQLWMMRALFRSWRARWQREDLPFVIVQKPSGQGCRWQPPTDGKDAAPFPALPATPRETDQRYTGGFWRDLFNTQIKEPNVYMVIADDLGPGNHPRDKDRYGRRMARVALGAVYKTGDEYFGPKYESMTVKGDRIRLRFSHVGKGLTARGTDHPQGFMIAGKDRAFHWAEARIDGNEVELWSKAVPKPAAVRYAWAWISPWANLFNKDGFPAVTFRTDDWASSGPYLETR